MPHVKNRLKSAFYTYFMFFSQKKVPKFVRLAPLGELKKLRPTLQNPGSAPVFYM